MDDQVYGSTDAQAGLTHSDPIQIWTGVLPGCGQANLTAKLAIYGLLEDIHMAFPKVELDAYVDDIAQAMRGREAEIKTALPQAAAALQQAAHARKFQLSGKSFLVASSAELGRHILEALKKEGVQATLESTGRNLGLDNSAAKRRRVPVSVGAVGESEKALLHRLLASSNMGICSLGHATAQDPELKKFGSHCC